MSITSLQTIQYTRSGNVIADLSITSLLKNNARIRQKRIVPRN